VISGLMMTAIELGVMALFEPPAVGGSWRRRATSVSCG
jgi:hypothetical protein